ncbi:carbohydrate-binding family 9-like protein [Phaeodactylibacter luteus]|uniref:Carbohydrate-binding family 9-like protein n=1 Tax=Phaeodactylibacter luteus TaxID=1564516 RepID=A0A5C6RX01_9BACT|nr:carbohydrate-binding family 9-like protein [Phaeodactylibacter luteus]TXB66515.1 carbohydrate-binding family 9-like protein [Phaeodactylibacter luteus]
MTNHRLLYTSCLIFGLTLAAFAQQHEHYTYSPQQYVCLRAPSPLTIDGELSEAAWEKAPPTALFQDIEGSIKPLPYFKTYAKMLWDDEYLYIAAELEEPHLWATYDQRDMVIFHENDFEVFIDPDGDGHHYYELEINALGTIWDLMLTRPYRDGGKALDAWDIRGLQSAVKCYGTLNDPSDKDEKWTVELALPWNVLEEAAAHAGPPEDGEIWRANFSRVQWQTVADSNGYKKKTDPATQKSYPEHNWVWSPQGAIAMHQPETWGYVQFSMEPAGKRARPQVPANEDAIRWRLWQIYYQQKAHHEQHGAYTARPEQVGLEGEPITLSAGPDYFLARYQLGKDHFTINENGLLLKH